MPMLDHFGKVASYYDRVFGLPDSQHLRELLQLPVKGRLLDIGGGTGRVTQAFRPLVGQVIIADESEEMLRQARAKGLEAVCAHAECLPFRDNVFERILIVDALHHLQDAPRAMAEFCRLLRQPDPRTGQTRGRLVIEESDIEKWRVKVVAFLERLILMRSRFCSVADMRSMLSKCHVHTDVKRQDFTVWLVVDRL